MKQFFRYLVTTTLAAYVVWFCIPFYWESLYEGEIFNALNWNGYGNQLSTSEIVPYLFLVSYGVISVGLVNYKTWARTAFVVYLLVSVISAPFWGISVQYGFETVLAYVLTLGQGAMLAMLFLTSLSNEFRSTS